MSIDIICHTYRIKNPNNHSLGNFITKISFQHDSRYPTHNKQSNKINYAYPRNKTDIIRECTYARRHAHI